MTIKEVMQIVEQLCAGRSVKALRYYFMYMLFLHVHASIHIDFNDEILLILPSSACK